MKIEAQKDKMTSSRLPSWRRAELDVGSPGPCLRVPSVTSWFQSLGRVVKLKDETPERQQATGVSRPFTVSLLYGQALWKLQGKVLVTCPQRVYFLTEEVRLTPREPSKRNIRQYIKSGITPIM